MVLTLSNLKIGHKLILLASFLLKLLSLTELLSLSFYFLKCLISVCLWLYICSTSKFKYLLTFFFQLYLFLKPSHGVSSIHDLNNYHHWTNLHMQLTPEQHGFELLGPLTCGFFSINIYYRIWSWLNPWMQDHGYRGPTIKLYMDFDCMQGQCP